MAKLIFGCGYLGIRVARRWRQAERTVMVVTRTPERSLQLATEGFFTISGDVTRQDSLACLHDLHQLEPIDTVLFAVGFDRKSAQSIYDVYTGGLNNVLAALPPDVPRVIYISTTGVYGTADGDWVDESTPPDPQRDGGRASLAAEQVLAAHPLGRNSVVLRLAGIYGPGRIPFLRELQAGEPIPAPVDGYLNLIHVGDGASAVLAADNLPRLSAGPRVYCVSDGHPVRRGDYYREVARQIGAPPPTFVEPDPHSPRSARALTNRRVSNRRMLQELSVRLAYPDYRTGLAAILG